MARNPRFIPPTGELQTISIRTLQARYLLRPSKRVNQLILGAVAHAQRRTGMRIIAATFLSNHGHLLLWARDAGQLARFMESLNSRIAREIGRLHDWPGKFWGERFAASLVANDAPSQVSALRYLLEQGCKENLVAKPWDWPGVHAAQMLLGNADRRRGVIVERTALYRARRRAKASESVRPIEFERKLEVELTPLPCWADLSPGRYREHVRELVREIERETAARRRAELSRVLGRHGALSMDPQHRPGSAKRSRLPLVHAMVREVRERYLEVFRIVYRAYREAAEGLRTGRSEVAFPEGCFPPAGPFVPFGEAPA